MAWIAEQLRWAYHDRRYFFPRTQPKPVMKEPSSCEKRFIVADWGPRARMLKTGLTILPEESP